MNMIVGISKADVAKLIASGDDHECPHIICVAKDGQVLLEKLPDETTAAQWWVSNQDRLQFRLETLHRGGGYIGQEAAQDSDWVLQVYYALITNWEKKTIGYVDYF